MNESFEILTNFCFLIISMNIPLLFGTVGEIITEKSGSLNLGVEGIMAFGALFGYMIGCTLNSMFVAIVVAFVFSGLMGLLFAFFTVTLQTNQNVTGLTITTLCLGLYFFIGQGIRTMGKWPLLMNSTNMQKGFESIEIPLLSKIPFIGKVFFSQNILVYLGIIIAIVSAIYLFKTRYGLRLRAIGENPGCADAIGINVTVYKYIHIIVGAGIMGIGGLYMGLNLNGSFEGSKCWINGYGWIAIALVIFAKWNPAKAIAGTLLFGLFNTLKNYNTSLVFAFPEVLGWLGKIPPALFEALPFIITALVLVFESANKKNKKNEPAAIGQNYYREDR